MPVAVEVVPELVVPELVVPDVVPEPVVPELVVPEVVLVVVPAAVVDETVFPLAVPTFQPTRRIPAEARAAAVLLRVLIVVPSKRVERLALTTTLTTQAVREL